MTTLTVNTRTTSDMVDVTGQVSEVVRQSGVCRGYVIVFVPHTTACCTINENADPDVQHDILLTLNELIPRNRAGYRHAEGNSDAHVKASMIGFSETILVEDGELVLGTWQGVYFVDFDGPRRRKLQVRVVSDD